MIIYCFCHTYHIYKKGLENEIFQTKDLPTLFLDNYEIRKDGSLWHEDYDYEDQSDPSKEGIEKCFGILTKVNRRWEFMEYFTGEIRFYTIIDDVWFDFSTYVLHGKIEKIYLLKDI